MANRDRAYYRRQRAKHIQRKKRICQHFYGEDYYEHDGSYSKGKIHCSCPLCAAKTNNKRRKKNKYYPVKLMDWKHSDLQKLEELENQEKEYEGEDLEIQDVYLDGISLNAYMNGMIDFL